LKEGCFEAETSLEEEMSYWQNSKKELDGCNRVSKAWKELMVRCE
jgi:hypothetical protein